PPISTLFPYTTLFRSIYPLASPGGWRQLGSVRESIYDPHRERPALLEPGDRVRFEPVPGDGNEPIRATAVSAGDPAPLELLPQRSEEHTSELQSRENL